MAMTSAEHMIIQAVIF